MFKDADRAPFDALMRQARLTRFGGELSFCGPSDYIKIDDELYIYSRVECEFSGTMTLYVLNANRAQQVGVRLGFDESDALDTTTDSAHVGKLGFNFHF